MPRLCLFLLALAASARAAAPPGPLPSHIAGWIEQLGNDSFEKRQQASRLLQAAGEPAEAALERAEATGDAEVKRRARAILADLRLGIYPETPARVADLARKYASVTGNEKKPLIQDLLAAGAPGIRTLTRLVRGETDPIVRKEVFGDISRSISRSLPDLLARKETRAIEALLDLGVQGNPTANAGNYAAYWLLTGRLADKAVQLEARAKANPPGKAEQEILFYLYRAAGNVKKARKAAIQAERPDLLEAILFEYGRWKELNDDPKLVPEGTFALRRGFRAAYARLAGDARAQAQAISDLLERGRAIAKERGDVLPYAKGLFFNDRAAEAIDLLVAAQVDPHTLFDVLAAQLRYKEAFAVADSTIKAGFPNARLMAIKKARHQWLLGQRDEALAALKKAASDLSGNAGEAWPQELIETEFALGRPDQAWAHAAVLLEASKDNNLASRLLGKLLRGQEARPAWLVVREMKGLGDTRAQLGFLRSLYGGKATAAQVKEVQKAAREVPFPAGLSGAKEARWLAVGTVALACKEEGIALAAFAQAGIRGKVRIGDIRMKARDFGRAQVAYDAAYRDAITRKPTSPSEGDEALPSVALYLSGKALLAANKTAEGRERLALAHLLPLGDGETRHAFLRVLAERNEKAGVKREAELLARLGEPMVTNQGNYYTAEGIRNLALLLEKNKQELKAADAFEVVFLGCLTPGVNFTRSMAYITVPSHVRKIRAVGLARAGRWEEVKTQAALALREWPGNLDVAIGLVPLLTRAGKKKEADDIYRMAQAPQIATVKEFPKSPLALNQLAWLGATCQRDLARSVAWARQAVALSPATSAYHDTLAEALFQSGKKAEAVKAIKKAITLAPKRLYYLNQLRRIEAGDPRATLPKDEGED